MHTLDLRAARMIASRRPDRKMPPCDKCKKEIKIGARYYSRASRNRRYYHAACWGRMALAD